MVAPPRHATFLATRHFASLDGLRCLAIVPVVWHHATPHPLEGWLGRGPLGVDLFFVLSGFLITTLLLRERDRSGRVDLVAFYTRRARRIFPLYFAVLALYLLRALLHPAGDPIAAHFIVSLPAYATFTANWFVRFDVPHPVSFGFAWSLSTEEQFYAVWPSIVAGSGVIARGLQAGRRAGAALGAGVALGVPAVSALGLIVLDAQVEAGGLTSLLPIGSLARRIAEGLATPIGLGALAALLMHHPRGFAILRLGFGARIAAPMTLAALLLCVALPAPVLPTHLVMTALIVATALREDHGLRPILTLAPIARLGVVSYGVYLLHVSGIVAARNVLGPSAPTFVVFTLALAATWVLAELSFRYFEQPLLARGAPREATSAGGTG